MVELVNFVDLHEAYKNKENNDPDLKVNFVIPKKQGDANQTESDNSDVNQDSNARNSSLYDKIKQEEQKEEQKVDLSSSINTVELKKEFMNAVDARQTFFNNAEFIKAHSCFDKLLDIAILMKNISSPKFRTILQIFTNSLLVIEQCEELPELGKMLILYSPETYQKFSLLTDSCVNNTQLIDWNDYTFKNTERGMSPNIDFMNIYFNDTKIDSSSLESFNESLRCKSNSSNLL